MRRGEGCLCFARGKEGCDGNKVFFMDAGEEIGTGFGVGLGSVYHFLSFIAKYLQGVMITITFLLNDMIVSLEVILRQRLLCVAGFTCCFVDCTS